MSKLSIFFLVLQLVVFLGLGIVNPLLEPLNMRVRLLVDSTRNMKLRPLMILTHRYNDIAVAVCPAAAAGWPGGPALAGLAAGDGADFGHVCRRRLSSAPSSA